MEERAGVDEEKEVGAECIDLLPCGVNPRLRFMLQKAKKQM